MWLDAMSGLGFILRLDMNVIVRLFQESAFMRIHFSRLVSWLSVSLLVGVVGTALAGDGQDHKGGTNNKHQSCEGGGQRNPAGCDTQSGAGGGLVRYSFVPHKGDVVFTDNPLGAGVGLGLRLAEEEIGLVGDTSFGGWRFGLSSYVTTAEGLGNGSEVRLYELGGGHQVYQMGAGSCTVGPCVYGKDGLSNHRLFRLGGDRQVPMSVRMGDGDLGALKVTELLGGAEYAAMAARAYVRTLGDGSYEVYGQIRELGGGRYEAWLSHVVDRLGGALKVHYDTRDGLLRVDYVEDPHGLRTRLFYADTEPMAGDALPGVVNPLPAFADRQTSEVLKAFWRAQLLDSRLNAEAKRALRGLVTSAVDPYGNRARFDYVVAPEKSTWILRIKGLRRIQEAMYLQE